MLRGYGADDHNVHRLLQTDRYDQNLRRQHRQAGTGDTLNMPGLDGSDECQRMS
jgi:hypothetical protein